MICYLLGKYSLHYWNLVTIFVYQLHSCALWDKEIVTIGVWYYQHDKFGNILHL